jgi:hypothetical protein
MLGLFRHRSAVVLAVAFTGGALIAPGVAAAAESPTVTFNGGCGVVGLGASSQPSVDGLHVASGSTVYFVNHLGQPAQLMVDGSAASTVQANFKVGVVFKGPATVALVPGCLLGGADSGTVRVDVAGRPSASPTGGVPTTRAGGSAGGHAGQPSNRPAAGAIRAPEKRPSATPSASTPAPSPSGSASVSPSVDPALVGPTDTASEVGPDPSPSANLVAVGAMTPATPGRHRPAGLLALIATVCMVGVSIATIRAIIAQRAIRMVAA